MSERSGGKKKRIQTRHDQTRSSNESRRTQRVFFIVVRNVHGCAAIQASAPCLQQCSVVEHSVRLDGCQLSLLKVGDGPVASVDLHASVDERFQTPVAVPLLPRKVAPASGAYFMYKGFSVAKPAPPC